MIHGSPEVVAASRVVRSRPSGPSAATRAALALAPACGLVLLVGCSDTASTGETTFEVTDSAGVEIVRNGGPGPDGERLLDLREDLHLGALESERQEILFSDISDLLVDGRGRVFVANNQTATVRVFDEDGTFVREFGGRGDGPSEIPVLLNDLLWAGDRIALVDWQSGGKTILYDTTGTFVESWANRRPDGQRIFLFGHTPEGWVTLWTEDRDLTIETVPGRAYPAARALRRLPSLDSLGRALVELPPYVLYGSTTTHGLDWPLFTPLFMRLEGSGLDARGNFYRVEGDDYRIDVWSPRGRMIRSIRRDYEPIPLTDADVQAYRERVTERYDTVSRYDEAQRREQAERYLTRVDEQASFPLPGTRAPVSTLLVARDGAVWAERQDHREPAEWWDEQMTGGFGDVPTVETRWDVFDPEGRFVGQVELPPRFRPLAASARSVVGVLRDELDVEYVVRYRIAEGG